jgi:hypothetical protein
MKKRLNKGGKKVSDDVVGWAGVLVTIVALVLLDNRNSPHKWHPAIVWTCSTFSAIALFGRTLWPSWRIWSLWASFLIVHLFAMWFIFDKVLPPGRVWGTIYVIPIAFVEGILLLGLIARFNRRYSH